MKKILKSNKGQAMTEMVIVLPLLILFFIAIFQFTVLLMKKIQLAMLERETMLFVASDADQGNDIQAFANEMGKKLGMANGVSVTYSGTQQSGDAGFGQMGQMNLLKKFTGTDVQLDYKQGLFNLFTVITGKSALDLSTSLFTATGGSFTFKVTDTIKLDKEYTGQYSEGTQ